MMRNPIDFDAMGNPIFEEDIVPVEALDSANRQFQQVTYLSQFRTQIEDIQIGLPRYKGTVGGLLDLLADLHNVSFNWKYGNYMVIERFADYVITVPQEEELMGEIVSEIEKLDADDITSSLRAGTITYKATKDNHDRITRYINRLTYNSPDVGIQMAIISVDLSENLQSGFDWSQLQAGVGSGFGTDGVRGSVAIDGSQQMGIKLSGPGAEVEAAISILDRYGDTRTEQSVLLKTIGGKPVSFDTVQTIPYVSGVSSETVASESEDGNDNVATNIETETQEVGLTLDIMPYYDSDSQLFTMDISFESSSILGFTDLSEDIRQPNVQRQTFENSVKLKPGEAIILGGLTYTSTSEEKQGVNFFEDRLDFAHTSFERTRRAMFIILRPSVKIYGNFEEMEVEE
jgi:type II secretory pathway component GspD/PulD (secretin)